MPGFIIVSVRPEFLVLQWLVSNVQGTKSLKVCSAEMDHIYK